MRRVIKRAYFRFYFLTPRRWPRLFQMMPWKNFVEEFRAAITLFIWRKRIESQPLPEELMPLTQLYTPGRGLRDQRRNAQAASRHPVDELRRCPAPR